jgi:inner membrane protein
MNFRLALKCLALLLVFLLLLAPIGQIRDLIHERQETRNQVVLDIARGAGYAQTLTGPLLFVPYTKKVRVTVEAQTNQPARIEEREVSGELAFLPNSFELSANIDLSERQRGIYKARIYKADNALSGEFVLPPHFGITEHLADYTFGIPRLAVGISDVRGVANGLALEVNGQAVPLEPGTKSAVVSAGVHALLKLSASPASQTLPFSLRVGLQGTGDYQVVPVGRESKVHVRSNWPHPSFVGEFLPVEREIRANGFSASWQTSFFATNLDDAMNRCHASPESGCQDFQSRKFGISFVDPVDQYLKSERATKYAVLFLGLTFAALLLVEALRKRSVHPIQYGLVGLALAIFFLLLLSLSEHIGFESAYGISAAACVGLIGFYASHLLGGFRPTAVFVAALSGLYGVLFAILSAEDYALLAGSLLVFVVLGLVMTLSRKINWSAFGQSDSTSQRPIEAATVISP